MNFNQQVWAVVRRIPRGKVLTYGGIARLLGVPHGARAVGWAMRAAGFAPECRDLPWYRVVGHGGRLTTNREDATAYQQKALLEAEKVTFVTHDDLKIDRFDAILWIPNPLEVLDIVEPSK